jgi:P-type conjugative transfer protein VirB9
VKAACLLLLVTLPLPAFALDEPEGSGRDERIKVVYYDAGDVVAVNVSVTSATQISFGAGEEIQDIACGFSQGWEFAPRRNNLYMKARSVQGTDGSNVTPTPGKWNTNLLVTTSARVYTFQINARNERPDRTLGYDPNIAFRVEFRYPSTKSRHDAPATRHAATKRPVERKTIPRNWQYTMQVGPNSDGIVPNLAYDDGLFTYIRFARTAEFPAAFVEVAGQETIVNTHVDTSNPGVLVIHQLGERFNLRLGDQVVAIFNEGFDRRSRDIAVPADQGTSTPDMRRIIKSADGEGTP